MRRVVRFLRQYKLFSLAILAVIIGLILQFLNQDTAVKWVLGTVAIIEALPLLKDMLDDVRGGSYGIDILAATAIVVSVILQQDWAAIVIVVMLTGGESLEDFAEHRAQTELNALLERAPQLAHVIRGAKEIDIKASEVKVGDKLVIRPGEVVPVDAKITDGHSEFDESNLTGESLPQIKEVGGEILSGTINLEGAISATALHTAADSQYQQIVKLVRSAAASQSPFVRLADRYSVPFTIAAYAIAAAAWIVGGHPIRFLEVIVVATPCPLLLAAPIALISGMARASKFGIIVKTGSALEKLAEAETIAFDKTGTLTLGELRVADIVTFNKATKNEVLSLAASLEQNSNHVVARAVVLTAQDKKLNFSKAKHVQEIPGRGLKASLKGQQVLAGQLGLLEDNNIPLPKDFKKSTIKQTAVYVASDEKLLGIITLQDEVRPEAQTTLKRIHDLGITHTLMVTGDNRTTAEAIAKQLGIDNVQAEMLPGDKLHALESVHERPLVFVGDGVNDAPVLTAADVGIALGARGSTAASESADMVIMTEGVGKVATAIAIAKRTFSIARQSILVGIFISLALMIVFATGKFSPLLGAILQEVVDIIVIFNALRAHTVLSD